MNDANLFLRSLTGYTTAFTIKELKQEDINELEEFARTIPALIDKLVANNALKPTSDQINTVHRLFLGFFAKDATNFRFFKGDVVLMLQISQFINVKIKRNGQTEDFEFFAENAESVTLGTIKTFVGYLFCNTVCTKAEKELGPRKKMSGKITVKQSITTNHNNGAASCDMNQFKTDLIKILRDSLNMQVKSKISQFIKDNEGERIYILERGIKTIDEFDSCVNLNESDLQYYLNTSSLDSNSGTSTEDLSRKHSTIKGTFSCYCGTESINVNLTAFFRPGIKWGQMITMSRNTELLFAQDMAKGWNLGNYTRHLKAHESKHKIVIDQSTSKYCLFVAKYNILK